MCRAFYSRCADCGQLVWVNKPLLGSLHVCSEAPARHIPNPRRLVATRCGPWQILTTHVSGSVYETMVLDKNFEDHDAVTHTGRSAALRGHAEMVTRWAERQA